MTGLVEKLSREKLKLELDDFRFSKKSNRGGAQIVAGRKMVARYSKTCNGTRKAKFKL